MKIITLSNHVEVQIAAAANERASFEAAATQRYQQEVSARRAKGEQLQRNSQKAFADQKYLVWLLTWIPRLFHSFSKAPVPPLRLAPGREETVWNAGNQGEKRVADHAARHLSDEWTLLSGYHNPGGEIDQLLVGPTGVLALEIKFINGTVSCDGDSWWSDKYDKYGNLVEKRKPIQDKGGRAPSAQVNAAADRLQAFLAKQCGIERVARAVVFAHDASRLASCHRPTVDLITTLAQWDVRTSLRQLPVAPIADPAKVVSTIQRDHEFHSKRRQGRA